MVLLEPELNHVIHVDGVLAPILNQLVLTMHQKRGLLFYHSLGRPSLSRITIMVTPGRAVSLAALLVIRQLATADWGRVTRMGGPSIHLLRACCQTD